MSPVFVSILTFLAVACGTIGVYSIVMDVFLRDRSRLNERIDEAFCREQRERVKKSSLFKDISKIASEPLDGDDPLAAKRTLIERLDEYIEQAGLAFTPARLLSITAATASGFALCGFILRGSVVAAGIGLAIGAATPFLYVECKRCQRLEKLRSQLSDAFDLMARAIRAGQTMSQAMQGVADEFTQPIAAEFSYCYEQQNLGLSPDTALRDLARRTGLIELKIFVVAMMVQRQVGGNLCEMLEKLAHVVRDRFRIRGLIKALTGEGRMQAVVLMALPFGMFLIMLTLNRAYAQVLLEHPMLITGMFISEFFGALWIRKIINFDF